MGRHHTLLSRPVERSAPPTPTRADLRTSPGHTPRNRACAGQGPHTTLMQWVCRPATPSTGEAPILLGSLLSLGSRPYLLERLRRTTSVVRVTSPLPRTPRPANRRRLDKPPPEPAFGNPGLVVDLVPGGAFAEVAKVVGGDVVAGGVGTDGLERFRRTADVARMISPQQRIASAASRRRLDALP